MLGGTVTPEETAAAIGDVLDDYFGVSSRWRVDVDEGVATISGQFRDSAERKIVAVLAGVVPGVARVELRLVGDRAA